MASVMGLNILMVQFNTEFSLSLSTITATTQKAAQLRQVASVFTKDGVTTVKYPSINASSVDELTADDVNAAFLDPLVESVPLATFCPKQAETDQTGRQWTRFSTCFGIGIRELEFTSCETKLLTAWRISNDNIEEEFSSPMNINPKVDIAVKLGA